MVQIVGIFLTGASSTGKTTLCRALEKRLEVGGIPVVHVTEVARTVMRTQGFTRQTVGTLAMQRAILRAQVEAEEKALRQISHIIGSNESIADRASATIVLLCDRCAIDPVVYATMKIDESEVLSLKEDPLFQKALLRYGGQAIESQLPRLGAESTTLRPIVILTDGVKEWQGIDDGVRSLYDPFDVTRYFRHTLGQMGVKYSELGENIKDIDKRVDWVLEVSGLGPLKDQEQQTGRGQRMHQKVRTRHR